MTTVRVLVVLPMTVLVLRSSFNSALFMVMRSVLISDGEGLAFILAKKQPVSKRASRNLGEAGLQVGSQG